MSGKRETKREVFRDVLMCYHLLWHLAHPETREKVETEERIKDVLGIFKRRYEEAE